MVWRGSARANSIAADGRSATVSDNGRGIPVDIHADTGTSALEVVLTTTHAGGKFDHNTYKVSGGLHGVGVTVVNALSEWLEAEVHRGGQIWKQEYRAGIAQSPVRSTGATQRTGTTIKFLPDHTIFTATIIFDYDTLERRLRELSYLNPGVKITLTVNGQPREADVWGGESLLTALREQLGLPLLIHGETTDPSVDVFDGTVGSGGVNSIVASSCEMPKKVVTASQSLFSR